jgi:hypothetical protein
MIPQMTKETPPFVRFEYQEAGRDVEASEKAGRPIPLIKPMVIVMQRGSKDEWVGVADDWLAEKHKQASEGTYPPQWSDQFHKMYAAFLKGDELPPTGTPIRTWSAITREQVIRLTGNNIRTVEELAEMPDASLMSHIGLDGRNLRDLAKAFIAEGKAAGGAAKEIADLKEENRRLKDEQKRMADSLAALEAQMPKRKTA